MPSRKQEPIIRSILKSSVVDRYSITFNCSPNEWFVSSPCQLPGDLEVEAKNILQSDALLYRVLSVLSINSRPVQLGVPLPGGKLCNTIFISAGLIFSLRVFTRMLALACVYIRRMTESMNYKFIIWNIETWSLKKRWICIN